MTLSRLFDKARFASYRGDVVAFERYVIRLFVQLRRYAEADDTTLQRWQVDDAYNSYIERNTDEDDFIELEITVDVDDPNARDDLLADVSPLVEQGP